MLSFYQIKSLKLKISFNLLFISVLLITSVGQLSAQEDDFKEVLSSFQNYSSQYREVAYCHLNKSTFIKGEMLGFSGYVLNKDVKAPSQFAKNLYCVITDSADKIVKSKLVKVNDGFANNVFKIDSLFTSGQYTFKAYTNWMKNFDERNAFVESFRVIDPTVNEVVINDRDNDVLDAQFLPEGGHFVDGVKTNVGVTLKNRNGFGIADVSADVYDENNTYITNFKTNANGISRFLLQPEMHNKYRVEFTYLNKVHSYYIENIESKGIGISVNDFKGNVVITFKTNSKTLEDIKDQTYKLVVHNGKTIKAIDILFTEKQLVKQIDYEQLFPGVNVFTLFDSNNKPIVERTFFNYQGISFIKPNGLTANKIKDSVSITVPLNLIRGSDKANISVSILPAKTTSYNKHHNIISYIYLQPYVNGFIENASYYFDDINRKSKYDLDNLLITQGWSSYSWQKVFNNVSDSFAYEDGIVVTANKNNDLSKKYILYPLKNNDGDIVELSETDQSFVKSGLYPMEDEHLKLGVLNNKGKVSKVNMYVQYEPSKIPEFNNQFDVLAPKSKTVSSFSQSTTLKKPFTLIDTDELQLLEEVYLESSTRDVRVRKLKESAFYNTDVFDDKMRFSNISLPVYLTSYVSGYYAYEQGGELIIRSITNTSLWNPNQSPLVFLDDMPLSNFDILVNFDMTTVDYITVNRHGLGESFRGVGGVIKIYTLKNFNRKREVDIFGKYQFPLAFSETKKYYVPKYGVYNDDFYSDFGVVDWIPNCKIDRYGKLNFTVYNPNNSNINLYIEGITSSGAIISKKHTLTLN